MTTETTCPKCKETFNPEDEGSILQDKETKEPICPECCDEIIAMDILS